MEPLLSGETVAETYATLKYTLGYDSCEVSYEQDCRLNCHLQGVQLAAKGWREPPRPSEELSCAAVDMCMC